MGPTMADRDFHPSEEEHALRRPLGLRDLVLAQILNVVGSTWIGIAAALGRAQTLTWIAAMLLFYLPTGAVVIYLNREMPLEGGIYRWAKEAYGDLIGFMVAWNVWFYAAAVVAAVLFAVPSELAFLLGPSAAWLPENHAVSLALLAAILGIITAITVRGLDFGKWIHNIGSISLLAVYTVLVLLPLWGLYRGMPIHWTPLALYPAPRNLYSLALFGQMILGLSGLEYVAIFAGESRSPARTIGQSVVFATPVICAMFILGTASTVAFAGSAKINFIAPIPQTFRWALGNEGLGGAFAFGAILLLQIRLLGVLSLVFSAVTRLPLTAGWDHLLPEWFTRLDARTKMPVNSIFATAGFIFALLVLGSVGVHAQEAFQVLSNASSTHYAVAYLAMFAIPLAGARTLRKKLPWWLKWTSLLGVAATLFGLLIAAYPFVAVVNPAGYAFKILGTTIVSNALALAFYMTRERTIMEARKVERNV
jgi:amino acid transporter